MSVLKKIGQAIIKGAAIGSEIMNFPFVSQILQGVAGRIGGKVGADILLVQSDFNALSGIAATAEVMYPVTGTGSQRLAASVPMTQSIVQQWAASNLPGHNTVKVSPEKFAADLAKLQSAWVDILNDFGA